MNWEDIKEKVFSEMNFMKSRGFHYRMLLLTGGGIFVDGYNIIIISYGLAGILLCGSLQYYTKIYK